LPFGTLLNFKKDVSVEQPRVLVVAPLSGHFATLLRSTVRTLLPDHDVYITDWHNARDVSLDHGPFGFDDYVAYIIRFLEELGPGAHLVAVCQPCVQALAAAAVMAADGNPAQPRSMTLMAGPVDTRINPTKVNKLATSKPMTWFERNLIARVPHKYGGSRRRVYPGFVQLIAFVSMNVNRHYNAHQELHENLANGEIEKAEVIKKFYDEYFAVLDLPAEFYLETVSWVFQESRGRADVQGRQRRSEGHPQDGVADGGRRARRHLRAGSDRGRARAVLESQAAHEAPSHADRRRALRRVQRQSVAEPDLPAGQERDPTERLIAPVISAAGAWAPAKMPPSITRTGPVRSAFASSVGNLAIGAASCRSSHLVALATATAGVWGARSWRKAFSTKAVSVFNGM